MISACLAAALQILVDFNLSIVGAEDGDGIRFLLQ